MLKSDPQKDLCAHLNNFEEIKDARWQRCKLRISQGIRYKRMNVESGI